MIGLLRIIGDKLELWKQKRCRHPEVRYTADAWDFEYWCLRCGHRWPLNTTPAPSEFGKVVERSNVVKETK